VKLGEEMEKFSSVVMAFAMVAAFLLAAGGVKLALNRQTRGRGILMIVAAGVMVTNVMIWTV
jgi:high-affinity Fe2+/Pb2+ permease